jgi:hypothetical protein
MRFAGKLRADREAVQAGLTLRHCIGQTEGQVTRLKVVKRQGYGRAKVDLIRKRMLRAACRHGPPEHLDRLYPSFTRSAGEPACRGEASTKTVLGRCQMEVAADVTFGMIAGGWVLSGLIGIVWLWRKGWYALLRDEPILAWIIFFPVPLFVFYFSAGLGLITLFLAWMLPDHSGRVPPLPPSPVTDGEALWYLSQRQEK